MATHQSALDLCVTATHVSDVAAKQFAPCIAASGMCDAISSCKDDASGDELDTDGMCDAISSCKDDASSDKLDTDIVVLHIDSIGAPQGGDVHRQHHSRDIPARIVYASITAVHYNLQCHDSSLSGGAIDIHNTAVFLQEALLIPTITSAAATQGHTYQSTGN